MRDHTKLRAFELADELAILVYRVTAGFPKEELFGLTSQLRLASVSVPSNIVEGCARDSEAEYLRFLNIAFGSLRELHYQLNLSKRLGFLPNEDSSLLEPTVVETEKVLNGLIRALRDNL
ncbi:MAG: four helix bundle protein [Nitrospira sp.]|nr:four helix bundle protein [Nitrospira sp.]